MKVTGSAKAKYPGCGISLLDHMPARTSALRTTHRKLELNGSALSPESTTAEGYYSIKEKEAKTPVIVTLLHGKEIRRLQETVEDSCPGERIRRQGFIQRRSNYPEVSKDEKQSAQDRDRKISKEIPEGFRTREYK